MLFHHSIGFPIYLSIQNGIRRLSYTRHALWAAGGNLADAFDRMYGKVKLPAMLDTAKAKLVEIEVEKGRVEKMVYRVPHDDTNDMVLVVAPDSLMPGGNMVHAIYLSPSDLPVDKSRYDKPQGFM